MSAKAQDVHSLVKNRTYDAGFVTDVVAETIPPGLDETVIRAISARKHEPEWLLEFRLKAYRRWLKMSQPKWAHVHYPPIDYQAISYYSAPKSMANAPKSLDEVDPKLLETYEKLGVPLHERARLAGVAVDAVFDSVSVGTTFREQLAKVGVIFCSFSHAVEHHPALVERYLTERRTLGFQLRSPAYCLRSLAEYARRTRHRGPLTLEVMAEWARLDSHASVDPRTWARRLKKLRSRPARANSSTRTAV